MTSQATMGQAMMRAVWCCGVVLAMGACAAPPKPVSKPVYVEAVKDKPEPPAPRVVAVPVELPLPGQLRPVPPMQTPDEAARAEAAARHAAGKKPHEVVDEARRAAQAQPTPEGYFNAIQLYPYATGVLYQVYAAPGRLTEVQFAPGEQLIDVGAGDTVRWIMARSRSGKGMGAREHLFLKPVRAGLRSNLVVTTDRRVYHLELTSYQDTYMASVSWDYPQEALLEAVQGAAATQSVEERGAATVTSGSVKDLNFDYQFVLKGERPRWMPLRVFDDGLKTYVHFPQGARLQKMPALFVLTSSGKPKLTTYRVEGDYYVVDEIFDMAELRLGEDDVEVVGVENMKTLKDKEAN